MVSSRRLCARPCVVSFGATGSGSPRPCAETKAGLTSWGITYCIKLVATMQFRKIMKCLLDSCSLLGRRPAVMGKPTEVGVRHRTWRNRGQGLFSYGARTGGKGLPSQREEHGYGAIRRA